MTRHEVHRLLSRLVRWADEEPSCRALALVGSWARGAAREDFDVDVLMLTPARDRWAQDDRWLRRLLAEAGYPKIEVKPEVWGISRSLRAAGSGGLELEFGLADVSWADLDPMDEGTRRVASNGLEPLVDKDGLLRRLLAAL